MIASKNNNNKLNNYLLNFFGEKNWWKYGGVDFMDRWYRGLRLFGLKILFNVCWSNKYCCQQFAGCFFNQKSNCLFSTDLPKNFLFLSMGNQRGETLKLFLIIGNPLIRKEKNLETRRSSDWERSLRKILFSREQK